MSSQPPFQPTPEQRDICESDAPTLLVLGGAGTGKTVTAAAAARAHLLLRDGVAEPGTALERVLFLTFSRTAVSQILKRSKGILGDVVHRVDISTFHGLAWQLVRDFGRYNGHGRYPSLRGEAESKLFRADPAVLSYDDLLPEALKILTVPLIGTLTRRRWSLVICDEFQDTDDQQWMLLENLTEAANRLLLLGDPNQMIYDSFLGWKGVGPRRLTAAQARPGAQQIALPLGSHRDPTQLMPTIGEAARVRNFAHPAFAHAIRQGRLRIVPGVDSEPAADDVCQAMEASRRDGAHSFGIFVHGNEPTATLSAALTERGIDHVAVGLSESYGEALKAIIAMLRFASGRSEWDEVLVRLAVFYTSTVRSKQAPQLAFAIGTDRTQGLLERRLADLRTELSAATDLDAAVGIAAKSWTELDLRRGTRSWRRASAEVGRLITAAGGETSGLDAVQREVDGIRASSFTEADAGDKSPVQVMNLHQTKGREADAIIAVFRASDYFGKEQEPFASASRLLYVVLTRARQQVTLLLPTAPHPLVAPLALLVK
ncbi:UvrD-helicase domain-containing protein [Actinomycetospora flava]|uniref:UvrD-helicase domain-containing protein n=1 Tax=Actinomycetospora flava TaxID=3129232 RepID=A0ABU8M520_9PSEU